MTEHRCRWCGRLLSHDGEVWVAEDGETECVSAPADVEVHQHA